MSICEDINSESIFCEYLWIFICISMYFYVFIVVPSYYLCYYCPHWARQDWENLYEDHSNWDKDGGLFRTIIRRTNHRSTYLLLYLLQRRNPLLLKIKAMSLLPAYSLISFGQLWVSKYSFFESVKAHFYLNRESRSWLLSQGSGLSQ